MNPYVSNDLSYIDSAKSLLEADLVLRQRQVSRLASERSSVRHMVAPSGFGKSSLAFLYGKLAFGLKRFWWVDASDPRFVLALDSRSDLEDPLVRIVDLRSPSLLVFDSVPSLSSSRSRAFASLLVRAQSRGWEVVVCSRPSSGLDLESGLSVLRRTPSSETHAHSLSVSVLRAGDLLLSADELVALFPQADVDSLPAGDISRVACCAFDPAEGREGFLERMSPGPDDLAGCVCALSLVASPASASGLFSLAGTFAESVRPSLELDWPCSGLEPGSDVCRPSWLDEDERLYLFKRLAGTFEKAFSQACEAPHSSSSESLSRRLCRHLVARGDVSLAGRIVALSEDPSAISSFVSDRGVGLLSSCKPLALCTLLESVDEERLGWERHAQLVLSLSLLGDAPAALALLERRRKTFSRSRKKGGLEGLLGMLVLALDGRVSPSRQGMRAAVELVAEESGESTRRKGAIAFCFGRSSKLALMGEAKLATHLGFLLQDPSSFREGAKVGELAFALLLRRAMGLRPRASGRLSRSLLALAEFVSDVPGKPWVDLVMFDLLSSWFGRESLGEYELVDRAQVLKDDLSAQRRSWRKRSRIVPKGQGSVPSFSPIAPSFGGGVRAQSSCVVPAEQAKLGCLRVFGGFDLSLPTSVDEPTSASVRYESVRLRAKGRLLVGLLAANHGCEMSREWLGGQLWPHVDAHSQQVSFYSLWSYVTRTIRSYEAPPFLESTRSAASFKDGVIRLDVQEVDEACARLEKGGFSPQECVRLVGRIRNAYRGPFMPGVEHAEVETIRSMWEKRVIDALLRTQSCLEGAGELSVLEEALAFAFRLDPSRQDVCHALMLAQRNLGRHADATSSFVTCRKAAADNHGIGVVPQLSNLYQEVLAEVS